MCGGTLIGYTDNTRRGENPYRGYDAGHSGLNSSTDEIADLAAWLAGIRPDIPASFRHHPDYRMSEPAPIPVDELLALADGAQVS